MSVELPSLTETAGGTFGDFFAARLDAARWVVLDAQARPLEICSSEGQRIVERVRAKAALTSDPIPATPNPLQVTDTWRAFLANQAIGAGAAFGSPLVELLQTPMDTWDDSDMNVVTGLMTWIAFYAGADSIRYKDGGAIPPGAILLAGNSRTLQFPGTDTLPTVEKFAGSAATDYANADPLPTCQKIPQPETLPPLGPPASAPTRSTYVAKAAE